MRSLILWLAVASLVTSCKKNVDSISSDQPTAHLYDNLYQAVSEITVTSDQLASMNQKNTSLAFWYEIMQDKTVGKNTNAVMSKLKAQGYKINLVIGNSLLNKWETIADAFPNYKVINRAFGGALAEHVQAYLDDLGVEYADNLFLYFGENEFLANYRKDLIDENMIKAVKYWKQKNPRLRVVFIEMQVCPSLWVDPSFRFSVAESGNKEVETLVNSQLRGYANSVSYVHIADMNRAMKTKRYPYAPRTECFITETINGKTQRVHMNATGYGVWKEVLAPYMIR